MKKRLGLSALILVLFFTGCAAKDGGLDPNSPVTLGMWHNYGGQMQSTMDQLIDEFNATVGKEKGIVISVTSVTGMKEQEEKLAMIANGDPGAPTMPDIVTLNPKMAVLLKAKELIAPLDSYFSNDELNLYLPQFVEEGRLSDSKLYVFPMAKSTEVLFVNQTLFDRFSAATGVGIERLSTFEGIAEAAQTYYEWTDGQTPDVPQDGKTFFTADSWFNIAMVGAKQMGLAFISSDGLKTNTPEFARVWDFSVLPALTGGYAVADGYSSDLSKTGDIVCSTGSTAGILFYGDTITYPDNRVEAVTYTVLPYPVFAGGDKIALQRGAGMAVSKSTTQREYAAAVFLKWFTEPAQNMRFVSSTGYLPVTKKAFEEDMAREIETVEAENVKKLLTAAAKMYDEYTFLIAPVFDEFDAMSKAYETELKQLMRDGRASVLGGADPEAERRALLSQMK